MRERTDDMVRGDIGNFRAVEVTNSSVRASLPWRFKAFVAQGPWLFLGVVLGVAVLLEIGIGWMREPPEAEASAAVETAPAAKAPASSLRFEADPSAQPLPAQATPPPSPRPKKARRPSIRP